MEHLDVTGVLCFLVGCMAKLHRQEQAVFHNVMCRRTRRILIQPERLNLPEIVFITEKKSVHVDGFIFVMQPKYF